MNLCWAEYSLGEYSVHAEELVREDHVQMDTVKASMYGSPNVIEAILDDGHYRRDTSMC